MVIEWLALIFPERKKKFRRKPHLKWGENGKEGIGSEVDIL